MELYACINIRQRQDRETNGGGKLKLPQTPTGIAAMNEKNKRINIRFKSNNKSFQHDVQ